MGSSHGGTMGTKRNLNVAAERMVWIFAQLALIWKKCTFGQKMHSLPVCLKVFWNFWEQTSNKNNNCLWFWNFSGPFTLPRISKIKLTFVQFWPSRHMVNWNQVKHTCMPLLKNSNTHGYTDERLIHTLPFVAHLGTKKAVGRIKTRPQRLNQLVEVRLGVKFRRGWVIERCFEITRTFSL